MKKQMFLLLACGALAFSSCSTMRQSTSSSVAIDASVYQYPTVADLDVRPKVEKTVEWSWYLFKFGRPSLELRKSNLMADVVKENGADVLLEPQMRYTKRPFGRRTLTVTGFPAVFKNFRMATPEDLKALEVVGRERDMRVYNVAQPWYKRLMFWQR